MNIEKQRRRMAKLGVSNFETVQKVEQAQADLLDRLKASSVNPRRYRGLSGCGPTRCGGAECIEACCLAAFRRRLHSRSPALLAESRAAVS